VPITWQASIINALNMAPVQIITKQLSMPSCHFSEGWKPHVIIGKHKREYHFTLAYRSAYQWAWLMAAIGIWTLNCVIPQSHC